MTCQYCEEPAVKRGMCNMHYLRWRRGQDLTTPRKGVLVGNKAAHIRIRKLWGRAAEHPCVSCGKPARDWAYDGTDPTDLPDPVFGRYSLHPEFYMPMCKSCHSLFDSKLTACTICGAPGHAKNLCSYHYKKQWAEQREMAS